MRSGLKERIQGLLPEGAVVFAGATIVGMLTGAGTFFLRRGIAWIRVADGENFISLATLSPIAAPENAQGPSAPAEAPKPIVTRHPINGEKR